MGTFMGMPKVVTLNLSPQKTQGALGTCVPVTLIRSDPVRGCLLSLSL
jgi:hypothetical protein